MKRLVVLIIVLMMTVLCTACDNDEESTDYGVLVERNNYISYLI